jgi:hypothetical protein
VKKIGKKIKIKNPPLLDRLDVGVIPLCIPDGPGEQSAAFF